MGNCFLMVSMILLLHGSSVFFSPTFGFPSLTLVDGETPQRTTCAPGCRLSCRRSRIGDSNMSQNRCYCRCKPLTTDFGTDVYNKVVNDIWQIRCGYLSHPFVGTALAMNESGLLEEFALTRCDSDYTDECESENLEDLCSREWALSLCRETCATFIAWNSMSTTLPDRPSSLSVQNHGCPADKFFQTAQPTFGNPYTGCMDFQRDCASLYERGYCQLKPRLVNCQETCGRCIGDSIHMPWNPIRAQLIQWAMNRKGDGTATALINYFLRQYSDYTTEVHRACREEASTLESEHRQRTQSHRRHHHHRNRNDYGE